MIGNEEFFRMFKSFASEGESNINQSSPANFFEDFNKAKDCTSVESASFRPNAPAPFADENQFYDEFIRAPTARQVRPVSRTAPDFQNKWGLQISIDTRPDHDLGAVNIILSKNERGDDPISRKKTRDRVVTALEMTISAGNLSRILTSVDATDLILPKMPSPGNPSSNAFVVL